MFVSVLGRQRAILEDRYHHTVVWQKYCRKLTFYASGSILGAMTGSRFVGITPWPGGEWDKAYVVL